MKKKRKSDSRIPVICDCRNHAFVNLTKGYVTFVDLEDITFLLEKWCAAISNNTVYAKRGSSTIYLHSEILSLAKLTRNTKLVPNHKNSNGLDNRKNNLELVTRHKNMPSKYNIGFVGVTKMGNNFMAQIKRNGQKKYIGTFKTAEMAAKAYEEEIRQI